MTPNITVKKVSTFQGHEGIGMNADVYVNGTYIGHAHDAAYGGEIDFQRDVEPNNAAKDKKIKDLIKSVHDYAASLPKIKPEGYSFEFQPDFNYLIDEAVNKVIAEKEEKKKQKKFKKGFAWGVPNANRYTYLPLGKGLTFEKLIAEKHITGKRILQTRINVLKMQMKKDEVFLNASYLQSLGFDV